GMRWNEENSFIAVNKDERIIDLSINDLLKCYLTYENGQVNLYKEDNEISRSLLRIEKK
ncbi:MAG: hypothetical protein GX818_01940, partial [Tissierellia bacterium]|nr:hypothetical protein [Tissierellia bacterium]